LSAYLILYSITTVCAHPNHQLDAKLQRKGLGHDL
jgi:hypothetical protein